jgi:deoxyribose-phosphate aldolase
MIVTLQELVTAIDHTLLAPGLNRKEIKQHCREAVRNRFQTVCLLPSALAAATGILRGTGVGLCSVVAFPHGGSTMLGKVFEALECWKQGAAELDIVADLSALRDGDWKKFSGEIREILDKTPECRHKIIVEVGLLTDKELYRAIQVLNELKPAFLKTSTGTLGPEITPAQVEAIRGLLSGDIGIKAAGGVRTLGQVEDLLEAGASRIGTSTAIPILREFHQRTSGPESTIET